MKDVVRVEKIRRAKGEDDVEDEGCGEVENENHGLDFLSTFLVSLTNENESAKRMFLKLESHLVQLFSLCWSAMDNPGALMA
ncbi:hypothetical protein L6452_39189 [Arctium lappa]|uniref:Uncharacterized protein n=1 Tax=Arctium lappa TaxID=4217 RepID=A0ACB8XRU0_ARCLA|nr:hypothetical protein L6452_39189 [Arctium lappa]